MTKIPKFVCFVLMILFSLNARASECLELGYVASHQTSQKIINAFKANDNVAIAELMFGYLTNGPSQDYVKKTKFEELFSEQAKLKILETEGTKEQCNPMGSNGAMIANGNIWIADADENTKGMVPIQAINNALYPKVKASKANDFFWSSDLGDLHPACFSTLWWSSDNYDLFAEHFGIMELEQFKAFPGGFFGQEIDTFNPVKQGWAKDEPQSLGFRTSDCIDASEKLDLGKDNRVQVTNCASNADCSYKSYKLHRVIEQDFCTKLADNFHGTCSSSYLVSVKEGEGISETSWAIYGLFSTETDGEVIFPLANFWNEYAAFELIYDLEAEE